MENNKVVKSLIAILFAFVLAFSIVNFSNNAHAEEVTTTETNNDDIVIVHEEVTNEDMNMEVTENTVNETFENVVTEIEEVEDENRATETEETDDTEGETNDNTEGDNGSSNLPPTVTKDPTEIKNGGKNTSLINIQLGGSILGNLLGDISVKVLDFDKSKDNSSVTGGLLKVDIKDSQLLGNTHIGVLEGNKSSSEDSNSKYFGLVNATIEDSIVGNIHAGVIEGSKDETKDSSYTNAGLIKADILNPLTGQIHGGVLEFTSKVTEDEIYKNGSKLVIK